MKFLCKIPWAGFSNDPDGSVRPCCIYRETIKDSDGENFYIQKDSVKNIFHSEYMKNLRKDFIDGNQPNGCKTCWIDESNGYESKRQIYNKIFSSQNINIDINNVNDYPIDYQIILSNACNLKCRSCGTGHSTEWQKEMNNLVVDIPGENDYVHKFYMPYGQPGVSDSEFLKNFEELAFNLKRLEVVGGEPFYIDKWEYIWNILIEKGYSKNIDFAMSTNATIFNEVVLEKITKNFNSVGIGLSIDGMDNIYNYLRKNGVWAETESNILKYYNFYKQNKNFRLNFNYTCTISWINAYSLPELYDWIKNNTPEFKIWNNIVHYPPHMSITMLPKDEKIKIENKWKLYDWGIYKNDIDSVLKFMNSKNFTDEEIYRQYKNFKYFDYVRNEKTFDIIKHNHPLLKKFFE